MHPFVRGILIVVVALCVAMITAGKETAAERAGPRILGQQILPDDAMDRIPQGFHCGEPRQQKHCCHRVVRRATTTPDVRPQRRFATPIVIAVRVPRIAAESVSEAWRDPANGRHLRLGFREIYAATRRMHS